VSEPARDQAPRRASALASVTMSLPLMGLGLGALLMPPALCYSLLGRGVGEGHPSWVALGALTASAWLFGLFLTIKHWRR